MSIQNDPLVRSLGSMGSPASIADLIDCHPDMARRTLQRRLSRLVDAGFVEPLGRARARRYRLRPGWWRDQEAGAALGLTNHADKNAIAEESGEYGFRLSADSRYIARYIEQPLILRRASGYERGFLDRYEPGRTFYLSGTLRRQLRNMGSMDDTVRPAGTHGRAVLGRLLIDLSWASSRLEGNTYTRMDTLNLIEHGRIASGRDAMETQMVLNHKAAIEFLMDNIDTIDIDRSTVFDLHSLLSENLLQNALDEGRVRRHAVGIGASAYLPPDVPSIIEETLGVVLDKARRIDDPFEQSFFIMVHLPYLQPFADVNKRTSRVLANLPLLRENLCPLTFLGSSAHDYARATLGVYELRRVELLRDLFVHLYRRSAQDYRTIRRDMVVPDPIRLRERERVRRIVRAVILQPDADELDVIDTELVRDPDPGWGDGDLEAVRSLLIETLAVMHEHTIHRYKLRPSEWDRWAQARPERAR